MATSKPISTISYNTEEFLYEKLELLVQRHEIQCYQYIKHKGEDGDKDHFHVRLEPNTRLDPMNLTELFREFDPNHEKPLGVRPWHNAKEEDWILYVLHDKEYLKLKLADSKDGKIPYTLDDLVVSEFYDKEIMYIRAKQSFSNMTASIVKQLQEGKTPIQLLQEGKDVNRVLQILKSLQLTDYTTLAQNHKELTNYVAKLEKQIHINHYDIVTEENGDVKLIKRN